MTNLKEGRILIDNMLVDKGTSINKIRDYFMDDEIEVRLRINNKATVQFLKPIKIASKKFSVSISFVNEVIKGIDLNINDSNIDEYDYEEKLEQHSKWLIEEIGYPTGILSENIYEWGKIIQWDDPRSCTAGISILYF